MALYVITGRNFWRGATDPVSPGPFIDDEIETPENMERNRAAVTPVDGKQQEEYLNLSADKRPAWLLALKVKRDKQRAEESQRKTRELAAAAEEAKEPEKGEYVTKD